MKTTKLINTVAVLCTAGLLVFSSCKKEKEEEPKPTPDTEQGTANDNNVAEFVSADIESMGSQVSENSTLETYKTSGSAGALEMAPCATVTLDGPNKLVTVDFGSGCLCQDGRLRSGKLMYDFSGSSGTATYYRNPGFKMVVTSTNYVVDGHAVNIFNKSVMNTTPLTIPTGTNPGTNLTWSITANISITKPNSAGSISWNCNRTKELVNTSDPDVYRGQSLHIIWSKAIVKLNGSAAGTNAKNESYTSVATNLVRDFECSPYSHPHRHPFISGTLAYTPGNRPTRLVDFGTGGCDIGATVTINNVVYQITLP